MSFSFGPSTIAKDGLVLYLDAANANSFRSGSTNWNDLSGANTGTLIGGPIYSGENGGSIIFDGNNDYVDMGVNSKGSNTSNYTFGGWFKTIPGEDNDPYCRGIDNVPSPTEWSLLLRWETALKRLQAYVTTVDIIASPGTTYVANSPTNFVPDNTWVYGVGVWQSGVGISLYVNGVFISTQSVPPVEITLRNSDTFGWVLGLLRTPDFFATTNIATFHVYNRALSAPEVLQNYNALKSRFGLI